ncbi:MAG TPA: hypothetical protein VFI46_17780 [Jiangellaceae bacterium]|nr:hypothetical protein [Jiangellaceae bacterium]
MTRKEHLAWCKQRALAYVEAGDLTEAFASMVSGMNKHPETADSDLHILGMALLMSGHLSTPMQMRDWIEGFN